MSELLDLIKKKREENSIYQDRENFNNTVQTIKANSPQTTRTEPIPQSNLNTSNIWNQMQNIVRRNATSYISDFGKKYLSTNNTSNSYVNNQRNKKNNEEEEYNKLKFIWKSQASAKEYNRQQEENIKNSVAYKTMKLSNPNMNDEEMLSTLNKNSDKLNAFSAIESSKSDPNNREKKNLALQYKISDDAKKEAEQINNDLKEGKIGSSIGHILSALPQKALQAVADPLYATGSLMNLNLPTGTAMQDLNDYKVASSKYDQTNANINNKAVQTASSVAGTIGYMIPSMAASSIAPETNLGRIAQGISVAGSGYNETVDQNGSNKLQALLTGTGKGYASYAIEGLAGGNILGKGSLDDWATKTIATKNNKKIAQKVASKIYEVGGENFEELLENQIDHIIDATVNDKGISLKEWLDEQGETVKQTTLTQIALSMLGLGGGTNKEVQEYKANAETNNWINEAQKIIDKENIKDFSVNNNINEVRKTLNQLPTENNTNNLQQESTQNQSILSTQQTNQVQDQMAQNGNSDINSFNGYTQKEMDNIRSDKISIAQNNDDISNFVNNSRKTPGNFKMYLGKITQNVSSKIKNTLGINVDNYNISLKTDDVRKIFKDHGSEKTEIPRGQLPITENDFLNIPNIINNPDIVSKAGKSPQGKPVIKFEKNINGNNVVVTYVSDKHNNLELQTMYKFKNNKKIDSATALHENQTPGLNTSEMDSGTNLFINNSVPQNQNFVKDTTINNMQNTENNTSNVAMKENLVNNQKTLYNNNKSESGINGEKQTNIEQRGISGNNETMRRQEQGRNTENITNTKGQNSSSRLFEDNVSERTIEQALNDQENLPTKGEKVDWNEIERPGENKFRKHYRSIIESNQTTKEAKAIAKEMMGTDTYIPDSNNKQLERANKRIEQSNPESELNSLMSRAQTGGKIDATDIAVGERLIQYYSLTGDKQKLQDAIHATAMAGTTAGQTVQAMRLLNHQTPEGQAIWIQRSVDKINNELRTKKGDKAQQFDFTPDMVDKIVNSKNAEELNNNLEQVYKELGQQVHKSTMEQIDTWRYFAMLGNPRTHIRNIVGNFFMGGMQDTKNKVAGAIEGTVAKFNPEMERTHTVKKASKEVLEFAKNDIKNVGAELGTSDNKYKPQSRLESNMRTFKSDAMENSLGRLFKWNDNLLEAEDGLGLKAGYKKAMAEYITANNIDINNITDKQLSKARSYAIKEAQERTFHQANAIASAINSFFGKNKVTKAVGDAVLPFVKTPANVAKAGLEYGPAGLAKSIVYDTVQLRKGNITVNQYIDNISKGLTGSAITVLGIALAQAGVLKASGSDDDKKEKFDEQNGKQAYSIQIGDRNYSLDWLAPAGIPLMVGAEIYENMSGKEKEKNSKSTDDENTLNKIMDRAEILSNSLSDTLNPMVEMSMISGLTSSLRSFSQGNTEALGSMLTNGAKSYANQFVPTLAGQIAKTTDTVDRDTTSTKSGTVSKAIDSTLNQVKSKIPGLRQTLPTKKDIWGNDSKLADNWGQRFFEAGILPATTKKINDDKVVKTLNELYDKTGESSILPSTIDKNFKINGQDYKMTNEEYNKYKTEYGKTSHELLQNLFNSKDYEKMSESQKQKAIESVYSYAKERNKVDYSKNNNLEVKESTLYTTLENIKNNGGKQSQYLNYIGITEGINRDSEKNEILANSNYTDKTKEIIYKNTTGKDDNLYNALNNINIDEYLKYKVKDSNNEFDANKNSDGKSISGTSKTKYYNYVNNNISDSGSRLMILGSKYKLEDAERKELVNYINKIYKTKEERLNVYEYFNKNFTVKDGKVYYK